MGFALLLFYFIMIVSWLFNSYIKQHMDIFLYFNFSLSLVTLFTILDTNTENLDVCKLLYDHLRVSERKSTVDVLPPVGSELEHDKLQTVPLMDLG